MNKAGIEQRWKLYIESQNRQNNKHIFPSLKEYEAIVRHDRAMDMAIEMLTKKQDGGEKI